MSKPICHLSLHSVYGAYERQTELLIRGIAKWGVAQRVVASQGSQLLTNLDEVKGIELVESGRTRRVAARACAGARFVHAHDWPSVEAAHRAHFFKRIPYAVTCRTEQLPPRSFMHRRRLRKANLLVAATNAEQKTLQSYDASLRPHVVYGCASAHKVFATTSESLQKKYGARFVIGNVGTLDNARRGQGDLLEVAASFARTHPDIVFVFIGSGPDDAVFRERAAALKNVEFVGPVHNPGDYFRRMDIFAFPSRSEGLGPALLDAMDYSLPIVASAVGGVSEIMRDGGNGLLINPGNIDQLAFAIQRLYKDEGLREKLGHAGNSRVQKFTSEAMVEAYVELYQKHLPTG